MTRTIKAILIAVASVLVISLCAGLIVHFTKGKADKPVIDDKPNVELSGKVYDDSGNEMLSSMVYSMPRAMTISELQADTVSRITISATVSPENATDGTVSWSIKFDDDTDTDGYLTLEPAYNGANAAVLTCYQPFDYTAIITATSNYDATKTATCYVEYLYQFDDIQLPTNIPSEVVFNKNYTVGFDYPGFYGHGTVEGDISVGNFYIDLNITNAISERLGYDFTPTYKILTDEFVTVNNDDVTFFVPSPFECFAAGSGIDEKTFNEAFARAVYFYSDESDDESDGRLYYTMRYSYDGVVIAEEVVCHDLGRDGERLMLFFSLEGIAVPVEDVTIDRNEIVFGTGEQSLTCTFDGTESAISTDGRIKVTGKQSTCTETAVAALGKSFTKYLKMESSTQVTFNTASDTTLKVYVDTAGKKLKIDGTVYTSEATADGDNVITVTLTAGSHTITKGDVLGLFALTLSAN